MLVVAFSGKVGSGKSSVSAAVASVLGWQRVSFGEYVRGVAQAQHLDDSRLTLQNLGEQLLAADARAFCANVLAQAPNQSEPLIIDGVRHMQVLRMLRELVAPCSVAHVHLALDEATRAKRILACRGEVDAQEIQRIDTHTTEQEVINSLPQYADLVVDSYDNLTTVTQKVSVWIRSRNLR
ncbi:hypothetical protein CDA63_18170 [Hymenobacter amundsenii]|uniref:Dephospho-CoA kinase n=1 Tax=Hymenobacter amundsenii TaxID=2006685 RepID=A0A246FGL0_9BACT|nr:hypothetical protein CDA63_18170 [Hymenobacter amundsenii]